MKTTFNTIEYQTLKRLSKYLSYSNAVLYIQDYGVCPLVDFSKDNIYIKFIIVRKPKNLLLGFLVSSIKNLEILDNTMYLTIAKSGIFWPYAINSQKSSITFTCHLFKHDYP